MALTPYQSEALIREVDDAVRQDDMLTFWTKYGRLVLAAVVLALLAFGGWLYWNHHRDNVAQANSERFATLLKSAESATLDQAIYDKLIAEGGAGYKSQAELVKAALAAGKGDSKAAVAAYDTILKDPEALQPVKDAALIRKTALAFDGMKPEQVIDALKGLATPGNPWFGSAGELTGIAYLKMGRRDRAGEMFASLTRDPTVPETIKLRAGQMASMLGSVPAEASAGLPQPAAH